MYICRPETKEILVNTIKGTNDEAYISAFKQEEKKQARFP
ncbi:hypothetical protein L21SP5_00690 [Salinivirga cyanobacteriivorans]|uniref:Uncharacterized protein n=1 Tax=Salinivirga cyanobacteriivorans TaxID=1307839 RepID=A0A0S2HWF2_9BACT|nr:hypothetical protein L21SP5_00690 [Salinivirga cyanobacteriivorans]